MPLIDPLLEEYLKTDFSGQYSGQLSRLQETIRKATALRDSCYQECKLSLAWEIEEALIPMREIFKTYAQKLFNQ